MGIKKLIIVSNKFLLKTFLSLMLFISFISYSGCYTEKDLDKLFVAQEPTKQQDNEPPIVKLVTSTNLDGNYTIGNTIDISIQFNKEVNITGNPKITLNLGSPKDALCSPANNTLVLSCSYTIQAGDMTSRLNYYSTNALSLNGGKILGAKNNIAADLTLPSLTSAYSLAGQKNIVISTTIPKILSLTSLTPNGSYTVGSVINIQVNFDSAVFVSGSTGGITLGLNSGGSAVYVSGSGSTTLNFSYTVGAGENSNPLDANAPSVTLSGDYQIKDAFNNNANLSLVAATLLSATKTIVIDTTAPSIAINGAAVPLWMSLSNLTNFPVSGTCSENGQNVTVTISDGSTTKTGIGLCNAGSFNVYVHGGLPLDLNDGVNNLSIKASISDLAGNQTITAALIRSKDVNPPVLTITSTSGTINIPNNNSYSVGGTCIDSWSGIATSNSILIQVSDGINTVSAQADCNAGNFSKTLPSLSSLSDGANNITISVSAADILGNQSSPVTTTVSKDTVKPSITQVDTSLVLNGYYGVGTTIQILVQFNENITVSGNPKLTLGFVTTKDATCDPVSNSNVMNCSYIVVSGDNTPASSYLDYASTASLTLNGGSIVDQAGNPANLNLPQTGSTQLYSKHIVIDTTPVSVTISTPSNPTVKTSNIPVSVTFSKPITGLTLGSFSISNGTSASLSGSGASYSFVVTPSSTTVQTNITVSIASNTVFDSANNGNLASSLVIAFYPKPSSLSATTPTTNPNPAITVSGGASGLTANLYSDSTCTTFMGSAAMTTSSVVVNSSTISGDTTYYANFSDSSGNFSACSTASTFVEFCNSLGTPFGGGAGTIGNPYRICSVAHFQNIDSVAGSNYFFKQRSNIDFSSLGCTTFQVGSSASFIGTYDGDNFSLSNYCNSSGGNYVGLFRIVQNGNFKNINLNNFIIIGSTYVGSLVGMTPDPPAPTITLQNITVRNSVISGSSYVGGVIGWMRNGTTVTNVQVIDSSIIGVRYIGGIVGYNYLVNSNITNSSVSGNSVIQAQQPDVGGLVGFATAITISNSYFSGNLQLINAVTPQYWGGIVGRANTATLNNVYNLGNIDGKNTISQIGGIIGAAIAGGGSLTIQNSYNLGNITNGGNHVGGIVGQMNYGTVSQVFNYGSVSSSGNNLGGVVGYAGAGNINKAFNFGNVTGNNYVGGFVGYNSATISDSFVGEINVTASSDNAAGFVALNTDTAALSTKGSVVRSYSKAKNVVITGAGTNKAGFMVTNSSTNATPYQNIYYYNNGVVPSDSFATALTNTDLTNSAKFTGFDFGTPIWKMPSSLPAGQTILSPVLNWSCTFSPAGITCP